jgi:hypothetical protein
MFGKMSAGGFNFCLGGGKVAEAPLTDLGDPGL